jgi:hypothetical protein
MNQMFLIINVVFTLLTKALQEGLTPYHNTEVAASVRGAFATVLTTSGITHILAVLLIYLHYKFQLIEAVNPKEHISEIRYLEPSIYIALVGVFIQVID